MPKWTEMVEYVSELGNGVKLILGALALIGLLAGAYSATNSLLSVPSMLQRHDSITTLGNKSLEKILCLNVRDHRKLDWTLCYTNPKEVLPDAN